MTTPDTLPAPDRRRAATILLACLDEAYASPEGLKGLIAPLALAVLEVLIQKIDDDDRTRELLAEYLCQAPDANHRRAAVLLAAAMDDDAGTFNTALAEAHTAPGGLPGLLSALADTALSVLLVVIGPANTRAHLNLQILNAEVDE